MEMHCRAGWLEVVRNVEEAEQIEGGYDAQVRSELIRAVGDGETCSVCTAMITNELLPDAPTQVSTSGWDKGSASSTFAFCNGLDTAARKDLCSATVPYIMELAQTEAALDPVKHLDPSWQLRDSLDGILDRSPLFTQYAFGARSGETDQTSGEPVALSAANAMCQYLLGCKKQFRYAELMQSSVRGAGTEGSAESAGNAAAAGAAGGKSATEKVDFSSAAQMAMGDGVENALRIVQMAMEPGASEQGVRDAILGQKGRDDAAKCAAFTAAKAKFSELRRKLDVAAQQKQCYVCVGYLNELEAMGADRGRVADGVAPAEDAGNKRKVEDTAGDHEDTSFIEFSNTPSYGDAKEEVCASDLFGEGGGGGEDPFAKAVKTCDTSGVSGLLQSAGKPSSEAGGGSGGGGGGGKGSGNKPTTLLKTADSLLQSNLIELSSSMSDGSLSSGAGLPTWFKSAVMGAAAYTQTQRMSCQGTQLRESEILAVQEFVSCMEVSVFA